MDFVKTRTHECHGWKFQVDKGTMQSSKDAEEFQEELKAPLLPEMTFDKSKLKLTFMKSGFNVEFNVLDALRLWKHEEDPKIKVKAHKAWSKRKIKNTDEIKEASVYDWTFSTPYDGTMKENESKELTFSKPEVTKEPINTKLLTRPDPILFNDEIVLFEDELADNGVAELTLKFRVMPTCFLVLQRFYLRVDGEFFRIFDTRIFHEFGKDYVIRELQGREDIYKHIGVMLKNEGADSVSSFTVAQYLPLRMKKLEKIKIA